jgi:hypothetical protein
VARDHSVPSMALWSLKSLLATWLIYAERDPPPEIPCISSGPMAAASGRGASGSCTCLSVSCPVEMRASMQAGSQSRWMTAKAGRLPGPGRAPRGLGQSMTVITQWMPARRQGTAAQVQTWVWGSMCLQRCQTQAQQPVMAAVRVSFRKLGCCDASQAVESAHCRSAAGYSPVAIPGMFPPTAFQCSGHSKGVRAARMLPSSTILHDVPARLMVMSCRAVSVMAEVGCAWSEQ